MLGGRIKGALKVEILLPVAAATPLTMSSSGQTREFRSFTQYIILWSQEDAEPFLVLPLKKNEKCDNFVAKKISWSNKFVFTQTHNVCTSLNAGQNHAFAGTGVTAVSTLSSCSCVTPVRGRPIFRH